MYLRYLLSRHGIMSTSIEGWRDNAYAVGKQEQAELTREITFPLHAFKA
jgi:hypothetical protein